MAERQKSPREVRPLQFDLTNLMSDGATLVTAQGFVSRKVNLTTTLAVQVAAEDPTVTLNDNPGVGALIVVDPNDVDLEETLKVTGVTPSGGDFVCDILPTAEHPHLNNATVLYEPGVTTPILSDDTPTPVSPLVTFIVNQGADGQTYRVSVLATCNNGEVLEDETDVEAIEFATDADITKQPDENRDVSVDFADYTSFYSTTLTSAIAFVSRQRSTSTTVNGSHSVGAVAIDLNASPGVGALIIVNATQPTQEKLLVSAVSAGPTYTCTVSPLQFLHTNAQPVTIFPGVSTRVLTSTTATITGTEAFFRVRKAQAGQTYSMAVVGTLADGQVVQKAIRLVVTEI